MGTCYRRFRRAFFPDIVDFLTKSSFEIKHGFCVVALPVFEKHFHFASNTSKR